MSYFTYRNSLRRIARNDDTEFSNHSILNAMEKFVKSVNTMDETILVPCRLMDMKVGDEQDPSEPKKHISKNNKHTVQDILQSSDLFDVYNMLNSIKADLLWGPGQVPEEETTNANQTTASSTTTTTTIVNPSTTHLSVSKGHVRRPSTVSVASTNSAASTISDTESETGNENDSGIEETSQESDRTEQVAQNFRRHLQGLSRCIKQMTEAAQYVTSRYQQDIGSTI